MSGSSPTGSSPVADALNLTLKIPISWPPEGSLTRDWIDDLTATLDWSSRNLPPSELPSVLPLDVVQRLVLTASNILHREPNCVHIDPPAIDQAGGSGRVVIVGDVHGQLHDVLFLLSDAGFPSEDRTFVFNGDYVDRGAWGLETFLLLLAWKVLLPHRVFLLRGNHESKYCTSVYGFEKEVMTKFGNHGQQVYRKCLRCFEGLPLATIIASCVYTAHGGLFRSMAVVPSKRLKEKKGRKMKSTLKSSSLKLGTLEELSKARRTVLDPPWEGSNLIPGDVLWSDPSSSLGLSPNEERGIGLLWGPDCSERFLSNNHLKCTMVKTKDGVIAATWESNEVLLFCDLCIEEIEFGNRLTTHLSKEGWNNVTLKFQERMGKMYVCAQLKNKWDQLKKDWKLWKELKRGETGLRWDSTRRTIDASDDWWKERIEVVPAAKKFRYGGISPELEEKMHVMFNEVVASGDYA